MRWMSNQNYVEQVLHNKRGTNAKKKQKKTYQKQQQMQKQTKAEEKPVMNGNWTALTHRP